MRLKQEAERSGAYRLARRLHAVLLNSDGYTSGQVATLLDAPRSRISAWLASYEENGWEGLREGAHTGRAAVLGSLARRILTDILDSGPGAYGFLSGVWTAPRMAGLIEQEFGIRFHTSHVCRLLHQLGFSVQRPKGLLTCAGHRRAQKCKGLRLCRNLLGTFLVSLQVGIQCRNLYSFLGTRSTCLLPAPGPLHPRPCLVSPGQPSRGLVSRATPLVAFPLLAQVLARG
jgi:transposase